MMSNEQQDSILAEVMRFRAGLNLPASPDTFRLIDYSISQGTCHVLHDKTTNLVMAYVIWANVIEETWHRYLEHDVKPIYQHEWQEGDIGMILDVVVNPVYKLNMLEKLPEFLYDSRFVYKRKSRPYPLMSLLKKYKAIKL
ncbi:toxin-activating lysine-acyltransferase [Thalassomonas viridans]|uniref:Toxin-activating lysine-acyltransferase n=1 Tax=Thalassomonas viridans TaxID=137584 RepID=A0AAE9Z353_9GAMM|nr:toxin-activating lysine-acyltransferase [Thalassomonas viridans]WDE05703.1 toxin-activating lysine-acyltransferase [Thalassomonas viridans]